MVVYVAQIFHTKACFIKALALFIAMPENVLCGGRSLLTCLARLQDSHFIFEHFLAGFCSLSCCCCVLYSVWWATFVFKTGHRRNDGLGNQVFFKKGWGLFLTVIYRFRVNPTFSFSLSSNLIAGLSAVPSLAKQQVYAISMSVLRTGRELNVCNKLK